MTFHNIILTFLESWKVTFYNFIQPKSVYFVIYLHHKIAKETNIYQWLFLQLILDVWNSMIIEIYTHVYISSLKL